jgi:antitoxin component of MazEF toxin-antitoxin module
MRFMSTPPIEEIVTIVRCGNEFILKLSLQFVTQAGIKDGDSLNLRFAGDVIDVKETKTRKRWTEAELLEGVTPDLCGPELISGRVGREIL